MPHSPEVVSTPPWGAGAPGPIAVAGSAANPAVRTESRRLWRDVAIVMGLALVVRSFQLNRPPTFDELYHVLAAQSWAHDGTFAVGGGFYTRAAGFTVLIGLFFKLLGVGLAVARLPSIIAGTLWVGAVHRWTGLRAGRLAGGITGLLFGLDPAGIYLSGFARFYALQGLLLWLGAVTLYDLMTEGQRTPWHVARSILVLAVTWLIALYLQVTTLIALVGAGLWAAWVVIVRLHAAARHDRRARRLLIALAALALLALVAAVNAGVIVRLYARYRETPVWGQPTVNDWHYYEEWFLQRYPLLWGLLPVAAASALVARRRLVGFVLIVFAVSFGLFSGAAVKAERYLCFALPFFFVIWGVALAQWAPHIRRFAARISGWFTAPGWSLRVRAAASWAVVGSFAAWFVLYTPAFGMTGRMVERHGNAGPYQESDWGHAAATLRRLADSTDVVISTALPKTLYYVGRADVTLSLTELAELGPAKGKPVEFTIDPRTGRPAISSPESVERIMACYARGLVLIEDVHWHVPVVIPDSTRAFLTAHTEEVPLPAAWLLHARRWTNPHPVSGTSCPPWRAGRSSTTESPDARQPQ